MKLEYLYLLIKQGRFLQFFHPFTVEIYFSIRVGTIFCVHLYFLSNPEFYSWPAHVVARQSQPTYLPAHVATNSHLLAYGVDSRLSHKAPKTGPSCFSFPSKFICIFILFHNSIFLSLELEFLSNFRFLVTILSSPF